MITFNSLIVTIIYGKIKTCFPVITLGAYNIQYLNNWILGINK